MAADFCPLVVGLVAPAITERAPLVRSQVEAAPLRLGDFFDFLVPSTDDFWYVPSGRDYTEDGLRVRIQCPEGSASWWAQLDETPGPAASFSGRSTSVEDDSS